MIELLAQLRARAAAARAYAIRAGEPASARSGLAPPRVWPQIGENRAQLTSAAARSGGETRDGAGNLEAPHHRPRAETVDDAACRPPVFKESARGRAQSSACGARGGRRFGQHRTPCRTGPWAAEPSRLDSGGRRCRRAITPCATRDKRQQGRTARLQSDRGQKWPDDRRLQPARHRADDAASSQSASSRVVALEMIRARWRTLEQRPSGSR